MNIYELNAVGLTRLLGETELQRVRILARLHPPAPVTTAPAPVATRGAALTIRQAAARLHVSPATVRRFIASGKLAHFRISTRNLRVPESAVAKLERGAA